MRSREQELYKYMIDKKDDIDKKITSIRQDKVTRKEDKFTHSYWILVGETNMLSRIIGMMELP